MTHSTTTGVTGGSVLLTDAQARLLELEEHLGGGAVHAFTLAYELDGPLNTTALAAAIEHVARSHQSLRVRVHTADGAPRFVDATPPTLERRAAPNTYADQTAYAAVLNDIATAPIDVTTNPGWRAVLIERAATRFTLVLQFHHVIADRGSVGIFVTDLASAYRALVEYGQQPPDIAPTKLLAAREPDDTEAESLRAYWRGVFTRPPARLEIPGADPNANFQSYEGARLDARIGGELVSLIKRVVTNEQASMFTVLLAGFAVTLHAHTGQQDLVLCTPMVGRHRAGTRKAIGYFNNIVPIRLDLSGNPTFRDLLTRVSAQMRGALEHQDLPFHRIATLPAFAGSRLTHCLFTLQNIAGLRLDLLGITSRYFDVANGTANFDFSLFIEEMEGELVVMIDYKTAVVRPNAVHRLELRYAEVLRGLCERPDTPLSETPRFPKPTPISSPVIGAAPTDEHQVTNTELERLIIEQWREIFRPSDGSKGPEITPDSHFLRIGGDSIQAARLLRKIQEKFGHRLPLATLIEAPTPRAIAQRLASEDWVAPWLSLLPVKTTGSRAPVFCLHGGGGNVLQFGYMAERLHPDRPMYCLQPYELRSSAFSSVEEMATHYLVAVRQLRPKGPYLFAGASMGGAVVYEMARRLAADGESVPFVALFDYPGPMIRPSTWDSINDHVMYLRTLTWSGRVDYLARRVRRKLGLKTETEPATLVEADAQASGELMDASVVALKNYVPQKFPGRLTFFRPQDTSHAVRADPNAGWGGVAGAVEIIEIDGNHMNATYPPYIYATAERFSAALERSDATTSQPLASASA